MTDQAARYFPLRIELDYAYSLGELAPYFDALKNGEALASRCPECGAVNFPPRLVCDRDGQKAKWRELPGTGVVVEVTTGFDSDGNDVSFALISMDGAGNSALGRLSYSHGNKGDRVKMAATQPDAAHPARQAVFEQAG